MQFSPFGLCIEDIAVREIIFYGHIRCCPELLSEAESHINLCAQTYFPVVIFQPVVRVQIERCVVFKIIVLIKHIIHCKGDADDLFLRDASRDLCFGADYILLIIRYAEIVLAFVEHQVRLRTELEGQFRISGFHSEMNVSGGEFLFSDGCIRQEIEVAQSEVACDVQIHFLETMQIIYVGMCTIIIRIPFAAIFR